MLETVSRAARAGEDIGAALRDIMPLDMLDADAAIIRRTAAPHRDDVLSEIAAEYRTFKRQDHSSCKRWTSTAGSAPPHSRNAMTLLSALDGDWRKPLPADVPLGRVERRWQRHVVVAGKIDRTHWEMATYGALANALASGDIWVADVTDAPVARRAARAIARRHAPTAVLSRRPTMHGSTNALDNSIAPCAA
ncbi:hypothetical protein QP185_22000 [Sphingomonas aerolata]|uniref:hypothetical protein n=1 Tax=Sphingomonas aerolata TaxID=185951 RepID=UPI002FE34999